jgi:hypothetical protein
MTSECKCFSEVTFEMTTIITSIIHRINYVVGAWAAGGVLGAARRSLVAGFFACGAFCKFTLSILIHK